MGMDSVWFWGGWTISSSEVYWFDDGPVGGCRAPEAWEIQYLNDNTWTRVVNLSEYTVRKDGWDSVYFKPVKTKGLRLRVKISDDNSTGIHEWEVNWFFISLSALFTNRKNNG